MFDYKSLSPSLAATFFAGLGDDSRVKRKHSGMPAERSVYLLALAVDRLSYLMWMQTKDGQKGTNRPKLVTDLLMNGPEPEEERVTPFENGSDFKKAWKRITTGG